MLGRFLRDPESSYAAYLFANLWNYFIAVTLGLRFLFCVTRPFLGTSCDSVPPVPRTVLLSLSQTIKSPTVSGLAVGLLETAARTAVLKMDGL